MHANGNDFLITDDREILNQPIQKLSNRKTGVGFDQLLFFDKEIPVSYTHLRAHETV